MAKNKGDKASVLAFEKKLVPSDGRLSGTQWSRRHERSRPLQIVEKSVRGTISNRLSAALQTDPLKLNAAVENPNLQTVDSCALGMDEDTLKLSFTLKVLSGVEEPSACNNAAFHSKYREVALNYIARFGFKELATRYAHNIANARFLWRNRVGVDNLEVRVNVSGSVDQLPFVFSSLQYSTRNFQNEDVEVNRLSELIANALSGRSNFLLLEIETFAKVGVGQDVYPSEELVLDKGSSKKNGSKSKKLYSINDVAAMHSQKLGNALRTIDTWYPGFGEDGARPIAIEPYGAVTNLGVAYRHPQSKTDFYTLFDKYARGGDLENENQEHYVMAVLVRGGVFGEGSN
jgi:CRISPR-associated protein Csy3